jgi:hypothetical protein
MQNSTEKVYPFRDSTTLLYVLIVFVTILMASLGFISVGYDWGYREGQLDALNGKQMFEMQVQPDTLYIQKPQ